MFKVLSPRNVALKEKQKAASEVREESRKLGEQKEKKQFEELVKNKKHTNDLREKTLRLRKRHVDDREQRLMQKIERSVANTMKDIKREQSAAKSAEKMKLEESRIMEKLEQAEEAKRHAAEELENARTVESHALSEAAADRRLKAKKKIADRKRHADAERRMRLAAEKKRQAELRQAFKVAAERRRQRSGGVKLLGYEGETNEKGLRHGMGKQIYAYDGSIYEGEFVDGFVHGQGRMVFADGGVYDGGFEKGKMHGEGTYTFADGSVRRGVWEMGIPG